jgi:hypothetical protein
MPRYLLGQGVNLEHLVSDRDGALTDADVVITATQAAGVPVLPGVDRVSVGRYRAATFVPATAGAWKYRVDVSGPVTDVRYGSWTVVDGDPTIPPPGAHASLADLADLVSPLPDLAEQMLVRASRLIDRALLTAVYDPADAAVIAALREATVEQVAGGLASGDKQGLGVLTTVSSFSIGKLSVQRPAATTVAPTTGGLIHQAWLVLQLAGITGQGPWTR